ncbi:MAG TPA: hypothetical protein VLU95_06870 [Candidatus Acidoferrum sp.]|nr:hypothetical protein [Candidatus Acidoferrum sp.]
MQLIFPPLDFNEVVIFLAIAAIMLLITAELSPSYGSGYATIDKKKLQNAATAAGTLFLVSMAIKIATIMLGM